MFSYVIIYILLYMKNNNNSHCYTFEKREYKNGFLDSFVDATYILTMENSKRKDHYENQLKEFIPTKTIYIVHNKGYKKCSKILPEEIPPYDISDAHLNAMNHSFENNYNNILILEDDFIFNKKIKDNKIINEIKYVFDKKSEPFYFNLGPFPVLFSPTYNLNIYNGIYTTVAQSIIYNKNIIFEILNDKNIHNFLHFDLYLTHNYKYYFYKIPLSYQTFPDTDNKKYWGRHDGTENYIIKFIKYAINILNINIDPELGWSRMYYIVFFLNYLLYIIIFLLIFFLIFFVLYNASKYNNNIIIKKKRPKI